MTTQSETSMNDAIPRTKEISLSDVRALGTAASDLRSIRYTSEQLMAHSVYSTIVAGYSVHEAGLIHNLSDYEVVQALKQHIAYMDSMTIEMHIGVALGQLDEAIKGIMPKVQEGKFGAIKNLVEVLDHKAKLLGLYAPQRQQIEHTMVENALVGVDPKELT